MTYRLRLPGPTAVPERVLQAIAKPVVSHRGPEFRAVMARVEKLIQPVFGTANPVVFYASSGTGMMEASLVNILRPADRLLICVHGQFGERYAEIARALGAEVEMLDFPWGRPIDAGEVKKRLAKMIYRAVVVIHNESSTAVTTNLAALGELLRDRPELLIADSVSGLGGLDLRQDVWGVDIVISASQKALMCPPGLGIASVSPKARELISADNGFPRFYWDFRKALSSVEKNETPFTAPVSLMAGLCEALEMIHEEGLPQVFARHRRLSTMLRNGAAALGLMNYGQHDSLSPTVVALQVPKGRNGSDIVRAMYERHGTVIAGSRNRLQGTVIRIGTMGSCTEDDIRMDLAQLAEVLKHGR